MLSTAEQWLTYITGKDKPAPAPNGARPSRQRNKTEQAMRELLERRQPPTQGKVPMEAKGGGD